MAKEEIAIFWFRRDLRLNDNAGLYHALNSGFKILPIFIFDKNILDKLEDKDDARITFIHQQLDKLKLELEKNQSSLLVKYGDPLKIWGELIAEYQPKAVYTNHDYEPYAEERDEKLNQYLGTKDILFRTFKDQCVFEKTEVTKDDGKPYVVFTPYKRKWLQKLNDFYLKPYPSEKYFNNLLSTKPFKPMDFHEIGFIKSELDFPNQEYENILKNYEQDRNFPAKDATSRVSVHLRFGTISVRELVKNAISKSEVWLSELIWRDFYFSILWNFPHSAKDSFRPEYDKIAWRNNEIEFKAWCDGKTGYPIVDAGMRELNKTGFMHNRVRMIVASFLTKHLLIDWRWGENYFARKLLDFELSSNVGGWQWAAGCGVDAAPYFRIFNPYEQVKKFDKDLKYIKRWVPEYSDPFKYPKPIVDHKMARERCLATYKKALN
ncbi:MAG: DNA photolyase family protein [Bacteroidetes bacterium]|nr:DNA photolyase family protein [Bacteroidota bacterium]MBU1485126.1 DNA photolyase family protein [Bacteroidota bacterium]MBU2266643.1 DNA photolyase family protein [Bacteroidota bacterium]MBU2377205.1 DNA photolyase family protein [Bacteroidota bacterium]